MVVVVTVAVVIATAAPIDDAPLYPSGRVARGGVAAIVCRMATNSCKAVQAHGFPGVEPSPGGLLHCSETAVPPGHSAPAGQVESR